jgi:hypothetical protein
VRRTSSAALECADAGHADASSLRKVFLREAGGKTKFSQQLTKQRAALAGWLGLVSHGTPGTLASGVLFGYLGKLPPL